MSLKVNEKNKQPYFPPYFDENDRLLKIQKLIPTIESIYKMYADKYHIPGYAFGIMLDSALIYSGSGGYIDIDRQIPATCRSMFRIASITKSLTAMAILLLRDQGGLRLDDPVYLYIPEIERQQLTDDSPSITIRDLLTHSSGLPEDNAWGDSKLAETEQALLSLIRNGLCFSNTNGVAYEYSNLGYTLLGYIIQKVTQIPYQVFIEKNIWDSLGIKYAEWEFTRISADQLAHGYQWNNGEWVKQELLSNGIYGAMGGMITSIESFSKYVAFHQNAWPPRSEFETGPVRRSTVREMHQPWRFNKITLENKEATNDTTYFAEAYGYGLTRSCDGRGNIYVGHSGGLPGFGCNWTIMPEHGIGVILFANLTYAPAYEINYCVLQELCNKAKLKQRKLPPSHILKKYKDELIKLIPNWNLARESCMFAANFFKDYSLNTLIEESQAFFKKNGRITYVSDVFPQGQLRGYFIMEGENNDLKISFSLTPENLPLIQQLQISEISKV